MRTLLTLLALLSLAHATRVVGWPDIAPTSPSGLSHPADAAVLIGVERHDHFSDVPFARRDAQNLAHWARLTRGIPGPRVQLLLDPDADTIRAALRRALALVGPDGVLWVHFSGHGYPDVRAQQHLLFASDTRWSRSNDLEQTLSVQEIQALLDEDDAKGALFTVDASFSGAGRGGDLLVGRSAQIPQPALPRRASVVTWLAAGPGEWAGPLEEARTGLFSWHLVAALRGWADGALTQPDGRLTLEEVQSWVRRQLRATGRQQTPSVDPRGPARAWDLGPAVDAPPTRLDQQPPARPRRVPDVEPRPSFDPLAEDDGLDDPAEIEATLRRKHLARVDAAWSQAYARALQGDLDGLRLFVQKYASVTFYHNARLYEVAAPQVPLARRMLANDGRPVEPLIPTVTIPPGEVTLGSPIGTPHRGASEVLTTARLTRRIAVGTTEVTQGQYATVTGTNPHPNPHPDHPITGLNWYRVAAFCNGLSALDGFDPAYAIRGRQVTVDPTRNGWRLPTEAEWMAAAGAPPTEHPCSVGNIRDRSETGDPDLCDDGFAGLSPVKAHPPNELGVYGIHGNAAEWTADAWASLPGRRVTDPRPDQGSTRVIKGPSYLTPPEQARIQARHAQRADEPRADLGFRVVRTLPPDPSSTGR